MISQLEGLIICKEINYVILDVAGVGYKIYTGIADVGKEGDRARIWTHLAVREDALDLYGFLDKESLRFFELLIKVSGIGPKTAMGILSLATLATLKQAIVSEDVTYLTKVSGIGRKTAEKILLELRDKVGADSGQKLVGAGDALLALVALGYGQREAQETLRKFDHSGLSVEEIIRKALLNLSGHGNRN